MPPFDGRHERDTLGVTAAPNVTSSLVQVYLRPGFAIVNVNVSTTAVITSLATLFTLPEECWPPDTILTDLVRVSDSISIRMHVHDDGIVQTQSGLVSGAILRGQFMVPL